MAETTSRALELLNLLQTHRHWPGSQLAERLGVTARTLRRDIERLRLLGYQVTATKGAAGGYQLEAGAELPPLLLTDDEAVAMAIGLRSFAAQGIADGEQTALTALAKLEHLLPTELRRRVNALGQAQPMTRDVPRVSPDILAILALACRDHERLRFRYVSAAGAETERRVEPHSLVSSARYWFLVVWDLDRDDWRTFRVDRMSALFNTRVRFTPRELPARDAAEFIEAALSGTATPTQRADVIIDLPIDQMREYFGVWAQGAEPEGATATRWPVAGGRFEEMVGALPWIERGVEYRIENNVEFSAFVREMAERMLRAVSPDAPRASE
ncbi:MAG TPA: YafY family protein [Glaciibacter sp.]|nr:YafY family protein [Glaciibacter sp.]